MNLPSVITVRTRSALSIFLVFCILNACTNSDKNTDKDVAFKKLMHSAAENGYLIDSATLSYKSSDGSTLAFGEITIKEDICDSTSSRKGIGIAYGYISLKDNRLIKPGHYLLKFSLNSKKDVSAVFLENLNKEKILTFSDWKVSDGKETTTVSKSVSFNTSVNLGGGVRVDFGLFIDYDEDGGACAIVSTTVSWTDSNGSPQSQTLSTSKCTPS